MPRDAQKYVALGTPSCRVPTLGTLLIPVPRAFRHDRGRETGFHSLGPLGPPGGKVAPSALHMSV